MASALDYDIPDPAKERGRFKKTAKQREHSALCHSHDEILAYGGSQSAKTFNIIRELIVRGTKTPSRHLCARWRLNHAVMSLGEITIPDVFDIAFPDVPYNVNKSKWVFTFPTTVGGKSEIWLAGLDDKDRTEKVLGLKFSSIFLEEVSQLSFDALEMVKTRLSEDTGVLHNRIYFACNPPGKRHWSYRYFFKGELPDKTPHGIDVAHILMNPRDNLENLPPSYIKGLEGLSKRKRQRFLEGLYLDDVEGALWTDQMIADALMREPQGEIRMTVVAVDPAVTHNKNSDETGIIVAHLEDADAVEERGAQIVGDFSGHFSTKTWAQRVVNLYHEHEANFVVAETNNGGDLVEDAIHNIDPNVRVVQVKANKGKFARAEPVSMLYEQGRISHLQEMPDLEEQMTTFVPLDASGSPDRYDAAVYALTHLLLVNEGQIHIGGE